MEKVEEEKEALNGIECPITGEIMKDPVVSSDGHSYERTAIEEWFKEHKTSPSTGAELTDFSLIPNHGLRKVIEALTRKNSNEKKSINEEEKKEEDIDKLMDEGSSHSCSIS